MRQQKTFEQEPYEAPVIQDIAPVTVQGQDVGSSDEAHDDDEM